MKATGQRRLTLLVGMLLLSLLLVLAIGVPVAQAALVSGSGTGGESVTTAAGSGAQAGPSGTSSTTYWLIGAAVAVLIAGIGAWAIARRRKQSEEAPACELSVAGC
jgi:ABC-type Fe3+ transport system permease subunit